MGMVCECKRTKSPRKFRCAGCAKANRASRKILDVDSGYDHDRNLNRIVKFGGHRVEKVGDFILLHPCG